MDPQERLFRLRLSLVRGMGSRYFIQILKKFGSVQNFLKSTAELSSYNRMSNELLLKFKNECYEIDIAKILRDLKRYGINYIVYGEEDYPFLLSQVHSPPSVLYYVGDKSLLGKLSVAVVGTRKITSYGAVIVADFVRGLGNAGVVIVSGMALGIDAVVHEKTLVGNFDTIAVLGSPLSNPVPYLNYNLFKKISEQGLVLTEYHVTQKIFPANFVYRNRIIAGLSKAVVVIEAGERSGALITAQFAFEENRDVFAVPGDIRREGSRGTNLLIKLNKACLASSPNDVLQSLGLFKSKQKQVDVNSMTEIEKRIYDILTADSLGEDQILVKFDIPAADLLASLSIMETKGLIYRNELGKFCISQ